MNNEQPVKSLFSSLFHDHWQADDEVEQEIELLQENPLFKGLSRRDLRSVRSLLYERDYRDQERLFTQAEPANSLYLIQDGNVRVFVDDDEETETELSVLGPGEFLGELALCAEHRRTASAEAFGSARVQVLFRQEVLGFLSREPSIGVDILLNLSEVVAERLQDLNDEVLEQEQTLKQQQSTIDELREQLEASE